MVIGNRLSVHNGEDHPEHSRKLSMSDAAALKKHSNSIKWAKNVDDDLSDDIASVNWRWQDGW
jgi:hypothetical protein